MNFPRNFLAEGSTQFASVFLSLVSNGLSSCPIHTTFPIFYLFGYQAPEPQQQGQGCWMTSPPPPPDLLSKLQEEEKEKEADNAEVGCLQTVVPSCCCETLGLQRHSAETGL